MTECVTSANRGVARAGSRESQLIRKIDLDFGLIAKERGSPISGL